MRRKLIILLVISIVTTFYGVKTVDMKTSFGVQKQIVQQKAWTGLTIYGKLIYNTEDEKMSYFLARINEYKNQIMAATVFIGFILFII